MKIVCFELLNDLVKSSAVINYGTPSMRKQVSGSQTTEEDTKHGLLQNRNILPVLVRQAPRLAICQIYVERYHPRNVLAREYSHLHLTTYPGRLLYNL